MAMVTQERMCADLNAFKKHYDELLQWRIKLQKADCSLQEVERMCKEQGIAVTPLPLWSARESEETIALAWWQK